MAANISKEVDVLKLFGMIDIQRGQISALVNNADILEQQMRLDRMNPQKTRAHLCHQPNWYAREAVKRMFTKHGPVQCLFWGRRFWRTW